MDDIYGDLENYETENINELKNENKELKCKLEEYATSLSNLQKDFDNLSSEYKKLELNYSSLLKTARAEIDRKTKMITKLNSEKDQLVLNTLQNRGRILPTQIIHNSNHGKENVQKADKEPAKETVLEKIKNDVSVPKPTDITDSVMQSNDRSKQEKITCLTGSRASVEVKESEQRIKPPECNRERDKSKIDQSKIGNNQMISEDGVNHAHPVNDRVKGKRISQRRKSMPLLNHGVSKFSSDEEQDDNQKDPRCRRKSPVRDIPHRKYYDKDHSSRNGPKEHDITRFDEKFFNHCDSSREFYRSNSRYSDHDKHRSRDNRDRYERSQRYKKHYSPERPRYNTQRDYSIDKPHRSDYVRHRVSYSSPPKYNPMRRSRDVDRHRYQNEEVSGVKHKLYDILEEPPCKRMRSKSINRHFDEHVTLPQDREGGFYLAPTLESADPYLSLQSPDYANVDCVPTVHKIREIKATATTKLDDPRVFSNKYKVSTQKGKVQLSTNIGRNVDIKCIDTSTWDMDQKIYRMPTPLREKPQMSDLLNDICTVVEQPISNLSLESGEIECSEADILPLAKNHLDTDNKNLNIIDTSIPEAHLKSNKPIFNKTHNRDRKLGSEIKIIQSQTDKTDNTEKKCLQFSKNYTIPKIDTSSTHKPIKDTFTNSVQKLSKRDYPNKQCQKKKTERDKRDMEKRDKQEEFNDHNKLKSKYNFRNKSKSDKNCQEKAIISARDTVACDLELSDETSDYCEFPDHLRYEKDKSSQNDIGAVEPISDSTDKSKILKNCSDPVKTQGQVSKFESFCDIKEITTPHPSVEIQPTVPISKAYQDPNTKDINTKLCDLFGESSSLITPEDLGITEPSSANQIMYNYGPLFDNTQNAVDLNIEEMEKVQEQSLKLIHEDHTKINEQKDEKADKKHKNKNYKKDDRKRKRKDSNEKLMTDHILENANVLNKESCVVKTVIISSGVQNNCEESLPEKGQEKLSVLSKVNNFASSSNTSSNLQVFATSTPHKPDHIEPSLSVPIISCSSNNMSMKNTNSISSYTEDISVTHQNNSDVPDVRIIVKRRRKGKPT